MKYIGVVHLFYLLHCILSHLEVLKDHPLQKYPNLTDLAHVDEVAPQVTKVDLYIQDKELLSGGMYTIIVLTHHIFCLKQGYRKL